MRLDILTACQQLMAFCRGSLNVDEVTAANWAKYLGLRIRDWPEKTHHCPEYDLRVLELVQTTLTGYAEHLEKNK